MSEPVARKTVSLDPSVLKSAEQRMRRLKYRKFSQYVAALIEKDARERGPLTIVREETSDETATDRHPEPMGETKAG